MTLDEKYIKECIELAKFGEGKVSPNPFVGAVVLDKNDKLAGRGYHEKYGEAHAEVNALKKAGERAEGGTLYVNLEPCSHFGKTSPCADLIVKSGIKRLVVGMIDPNPLVSGLGLARIGEAGIEISVGVLEKECKKLNEIFIKHISEAGVGKPKDGFAGLEAANSFPAQKKPFIAIKTASTIDGKIAAKTLSSKWITSNAAREEVQKLRNKYDAIITGSGTIIADNPSLTSTAGRNPVRIIIDSELKTPPDSKVYQNNNARVIIATSEKVSDDMVKKYSENVEILRCPPTQEGNKFLQGKIDLNYLTDKIYQNKLASVLIEAGGKLNGAFIKNGLVDKFYFFIAPKILGDREALSMIDGFNIENINQCLNLRFDEIKFFPPDIMIEAYFGYRSF